MFTGKNIYYVLFVLSMILISAYASKRWKALFAPTDEYDMIKNYLLNESPLYGYNKPKIWIHSKFEYNARKWESFHSRSSYDLNQPYIHLTIRSIIEHCGDDFHVCLIDDQTFNKLIPSWDLDLASIAEPMKSRYRAIGMAELVYYYGGMVLPNSFLCFQSLVDTYHQATSGDKMFVCETQNHSFHSMSQSTQPSFMPHTHIFGANKNNEVVKKYVQYLKKRCQSPHFTNEHEFVGDISQWCVQHIGEGDVQMLTAEMVGLRLANGRPALLEDWMGEEYLPLSSHCVGVCIPEDEILKRSKYQWFASLPSAELMNTNVILVKYMKQSLVSVAEKNVAVVHKQKTITAI